MFVRIQDSRGKSLPQHIWTLSVPRKIKFLLVAASLLLIAVVAQVIVTRTIAQVRRMKTLDTMGLVSVALDRTLPAQGPLVGYDVVEQAKRSFPSIEIVDGKVADAWGRPIKVSIECESDGFHIRMTSAGKDGEFDTGDDVVKELVILYRPVKDR